MSDFTEAWSRKLVDSFPLVMGENESEAREFVEEMVQALAQASPAEPTLPHRVILRCAGCSWIFGIVEPNHWAYGKAAVYCCTRACFELVARSGPVGGWEK